MQSLHQTSTRLEYYQLTEVKLIFLAPKLLFPRAFQFAKNNLDSIRFDSHQKNRSESIRIDSIRQVNTLLLSDEKWGDGRGKLMSWHSFSCLCACCCSIDSTVTVRYCIQTPSCGRIEWSNFLGNRIDSSCESNQTDSNRELECTTVSPMGLLQMFQQRIMFSLFLVMIVRA